jgi:hypothetical protein
MSPRQSVDRQRIEHFLRQLGERFSKPGRIYLVGGTSIVYEGMRQQTLDIDLTFEIDNEYHHLFIEVVRDLKESLSLNIEEVSPADFIPLPSGHRERGEFINRYGQLDVFHFDLYSVALSKIARGTAEDFADVLSLLKTSRLEMEKLTQYFEEILSDFAATTLKRDPIEFRQKFEILNQMWSDIQKTEIS